MMRDHADASARSWCRIASFLLMCLGCSDNQGPVVIPSQDKAPTIPAVPSMPGTTDVAHRPTSEPDRIILTWSDDPAQSQSVTWRTDATATTGMAELAVAGDNSDFARRARQLKALTTPIKSDRQVAHYHSVDFKALSPATKYAYRVGDGKIWSEWFQFQTANDHAERFSFLYFGDAQNDLKSMWSRVVREAFLDAPRPRFMIHAGDLVNNSQRDAEWGEWFQAAGWVNAMIPSIVTPGNHEYSFNVNSLTSGLTDRWRPQFTLPENGPEGLTETVYFLDFQGTRIISLNSNERQADQVAWLDAVLKQNPCRWTIVTFHHPLYSAARNRDNAKLRNQWQPVLDKYQVDLVLQGHDHTYARSGLVTSAANAQPSRNAPGGITGHSDTAGTVYVVSVSGPKMYDLDQPQRSQFHRVAEDVQLFQIITIDGDELVYEARTATGVPYDGFTLRKHSGKPNQLIEQIPSTPQRTRSRPMPAASGRSLPAALGP